MKFLMTLFAAMAFLPATAQFPPADSLDAAAVNREFVAEFVRHAQRLRCNVAGCSDTTRAVYDLYRDLFNEKMLLDRGIIRTPHSGRYITPQTTIDYGVLPADSTLNTVLELLEAPADSISAEFPRSERLRGVLDTLIPFRVDMQRAFRKTVGYRIMTFHPATVYPADSVLYINKDLMGKLEDFSKKGLAISAEIGRERNELLAAEFSAKPSLWAPMYIGSTVLCRSLRSFWKITSGAPLSMRWQTARRGGGCCWNAMLKDIGG